MYTPEQVAEAKTIILDKISSGLSLQAVLREDETMSLPHKDTINRWLRKGSKTYDAEFYANYARAYEERQNVIFEETIEIADETAYDWKQTENGKVPDREVVQRSKLRIEARQWALSRMNSKRFGNKIETTIEGGDKPLHTVDYNKLSSEALEEIVRVAAENTDSI